MVNTRSGTRSGKVSKRRPNFAYTCLKLAEGESGANWGGSEPSAVQFSGELDHHRSMLARYRPSLTRSRPKLTFVWPKSGLLRSAWPRHGIDTAKFGATSTDSGPTSVDLGQIWPGQDQTRVDFDYIGPMWGHTDSGPKFASNPRDGQNRTNCDRL